VCPRPSLGQRTKESVFGKFVRAVAAVEQQLREQNVSIDIVIPPVYAMGMQSGVVRLINLAGVGVWGDDHDRGETNMHVPVY